MADRRRPSGYDFCSNLVRSPCTHALVLRIRVACGCPQAPKWIGRVLLCLLLFLSTAVAIEAVGKALIAWWYTDSSRQKIITALQVRVHVY